MPRALVAGVPRHTLGKQHANYTFEPPTDWVVDWVFSEGNQPDLHTCWRSLCKKLEQVEAADAGDGVHVLAFHKSDQTRKDYTSRIDPYHRLRYLDRKLLTSYGSSLFSNSLTDVLKEETLWREKIRPQHHSHPLILPEQFFSPIPACSDIWGKARKANSLRDVSSVAEMLVGFRRHHRDHTKKPDCYEDDANLRFKYNVEPHGKHHNEQGQDWKFSFRLPDAMQYDIESVTDSRGFMLRGIKYHTHANISPHGVLIGTAK